MEQEHHKAMVACAKAVVEEVLLKSQPPRRQESELDELARLKRENADLRNTHNQLRDQIESLKQDRVPFRQIQGGRGRGMPQKSYGGYGKDTRRQPYKGKPSEAADPEDRREKGYRVNVSGQQFARITRIRYPEEIMEETREPEVERDEPSIKEVRTESPIVTRSKSKMALQDEKMEDINDSGKEDNLMDRDGTGEMSSADEEDASWDRPGEAVQGIWTVSSEPDPVTEPLRRRMKSGPLGAMISKQDSQRSSERRSGAGSCVILKWKGCAEQGSHSAWDYPSISMTRKW